MACGKESTGSIRGTCVRKCGFPPEHGGGRSSGERNSGGLEFAVNHTGFSYEVLQ